MRSASRELARPAPTSDTVYLKQTLNAPASTNYTLHYSLDNVSFTDVVVDKGVDITVSNVKNIAVVDNLFAFGGDVTFKSHNDIKVLDSPPIVDYSTTPVGRLTQGSRSFTIGSSDHATDIITVDHFNGAATLREGELLTFSGITGALVDGTQYAGHSPRAPSSAAAP